MSPLSSSGSSSLDGCNQQHRPSCLSATSSSSSACPHECCQPRRDLSTDLRLGLCVSPSHSGLSSSSARREQKLESWPPIKPLLRSELAGKAEKRRQHGSLFVKVYMEGIPIGRKLDLFAHDGYNALRTALAHMFRTTILRPDAADQYCDNSNKHYVLTYEDKEGDWMMVGDVPWEMFLTTVKRLKITRASRC